MSEENEPVVDVTEETVQVEEVIAVEEVHVEEPKAKKAAKKKPVVKKAEKSVESPPVVKKNVKKPVKKVTEKPVPKKAVKSAPEKVKRVKGGLRAGQIRILKLLAKKDLLTRTVISEKAPVDVANCVELIGSHDEDKRAANDEKHYPSLITLGLVKPEQHDVNGRDTILYRITAKGKAEAAKI